MAWMVDLSRCNPFDGRFVMVSGLPDSRGHTSRECKCSRGRKVYPSPEFLLPLRGWRIHGIASGYLLLYEGGEELVEEPFRRLIDAGRLMAYPHDGYWACMDTFKEKQDLEDIFGRGSAPWAVWNHQYEIKK